MNIGAISSNFSLYSKTKVPNYSSWKTSNKQWKTFILESGKLKNY